VFLDIMTVKVALVRSDRGVSEAYVQALKLIGGIDGLNVRDRGVTIKVGIYDQRNLNYPTLPVVQAVADAFTRAQRIRLVESDNHHGLALERLQVWKVLFSDKVVPFSLSTDPQVREGVVCGENIRFSHVLCKPNVLVSLHAARRGTMGSIFKNLLGCIPDTRKERFHEKLGVALIDIAEAVDWIDLAVIDGTYVYGSKWKEGKPLRRERRDFLIVGRDPVAVETVGSLLVGETPLTIPSLAVAKQRGLGETDIENIEVVGESLETFST
jgi:uncharacterized protein (DUF362 family)